MSEKTRRPAATAAHIIDVLDALQSATARAEASRTVRQDADRIAQRYHELKQSHDFSTAMRTARLEFVEALLQQDIRHTALPG
jgi:hypothetical protein